jgi:uncharacterized protein
MLLIDVNVLVYAHREDVKQHAQYRGWLEGVVNSNTAYGYADLVLSGFLRVVTHPKVFITPSDLDVALLFVNQIRSQPNAVCIKPGADHWGIFQGLLETTSAVGNHVPDAYLAALAIESGCEWVTADKGFRKFKGLKLHQPFQPKSRS